MQSFAEKSKVNVCFTRSANLIQMKKSISFLSLILCLQLTSCSYLKNVQLLSSGKLERKQFVESVPFTLRKDIIVLSAQLSDDTTQHEFIFDIGAFNSKVEKGLAERLGYKTITTRSNGTASGVTREIEVTQIDSISIGQTSFYSISAGKVVYDENSASPCIASAGIIGANLMKLAYWKIDYQDQLLSFSDHAFEVPSGALSIPFEHPLLSGTPTIDLKVGEHTVKGLLFDVGYNGGLILPVSLKDNFAGEEKMILDNATKGIYGGKVDTLYEKQLSVEIGSFKTSIPVLFSANNKALLGNEFLKHFDVYVDYEEDVISLLERNEVEVKETITFIPGVLNDSTWIVKRTSPEIPLQLGDTLIFINGLQPKEVYTDHCDYVLQVSDLLKVGKIKVTDNHGKSFTLDN